MEILHCFLLQLKRQALLMFTGGIFLRLNQTKQELIQGFIVNDNHPTKFHFKTTISLKQVP